MSLDTIIGAVVAIVVGGIFTGIQIRAATSKIVAEREKTLQETQNVRVEREAKLDEIIRGQDEKISVLKKQIDVQEDEIKQMRERVVELESQLNERDNLVEDFREYVAKLVIIMRAAKLDVPEFKPRKLHK